MPKQSSEATLYDTDFVEWIEQQAGLLRRRRFDEVDLEHLVEELEDMANRDRNEVWSRLTIILLHMLKCEYQPARKTQSWLDTISIQEIELNRVLHTSPGLRCFAQTVFAETYAQAVKKAAKETGLPADTFPKTCPYTLEQILE